MAVQLLSRVAAVTKKGNHTYHGKPITEIITNGFFAVDHQWTVTHWNEAAGKILSVQAQDIIGKNLWEKFADIIPLNFYAVYHKAFLNNIPVHFEEYWVEMGAWFDVITYYSGDTLSVSFKASSPPRNPGHPAEQLKILNELYQFITQVTNDCLWEWNIPAKELFWIDGGHKRVFGYAVENSLIPQSFWESRLHPNDKVRVLTKLNKTIAEAVVSLWEDEYRFEKANGDYAFVHDRAHIVYDEYNKAIRMIGATQDITARKIAEIQLKSGLELIDDKKSNLVLKIKNVIIELAHYSEEPLTVNFSEFLSRKLNYDYTYLANTFSEMQGITIEKFFINHKIERVKELLTHNKIKLTEIAYLMHYSSVAHLSAQFKKVTGLTPSHFKKLREKRRALLENM
jgi:PAS domain S-box-containing protein